jgi:hypothetical protein
MPDHHDITIGELVILTNSLKRLTQCDTTSYYFNYSPMDLIAIFCHDYEKCLTIRTHVTGVDKFVSKDLRLLAGVIQDSDI